VADALIQRFNLKKVYGVERSIDARDKLAGRTQIASGKDGLISIAVDDPDPKLAAALANGYVEELFQLMQSVAVSEASQRRVFFENQLVAAKDDLIKAEEALKKTQESTGLIQLDSQAKAIIEGMAQLRAQIAAKEVQLRSMRSFATENNPDLIRVQAEISAMQAQLGRLESEEARGRGDIQIGTSKIPAAGLRYIQALRNVKYHETIFELLAKQFEAAKIDEAKSASVVQVIDKAVEPEKKSKPHRALIVLFSTLFAFFAAVVFVFLQDQYETADPAQTAKWRLLWKYMFHRKHSA
jgi:tyrosine-protein kinase Etk/Wzc